MKWRRPGDCDSSACVEVAQEDGVVLLRTTERPWNMISCTQEEFGAFVEAARAGEYDDLL